VGGGTLSAARPVALEGYLAHEKPRPLRTLQWDYAQGPMVALRGGAVSYERGTPDGPITLGSGV